MNSINFLKRLLSDYRVAAITKSSRYVVKNIIGDIPKGAKYVVEYGPGEGVITMGLLKAMPRDGKLVAIELNKDFYEHLKDIKDNRLILIHGAVEDIPLKSLSARHGLPKVDAVVSGIPFTLINPKAREEIVKSTAEGIAPGGAFIVYQFSLLLKPLLKKYFRKFSSKIELRNLPPYFIMVAKK